MTDHLETLKVALDFVNSQPCRCMSIAQLGERDYCDRCSAIRAIKQADAAIALMRGQSEMSKKVEPAPNWCPTCGRRPNDPHAAFCSNPFHLMPKDTADE